jgi:hypothetical protein
MEQWHSFAYHHPLSQRPQMLLVPFPQVSVIIQQAVTTDQARQSKKGNTKHNLDGLNEVSNGELNKMTDCI